MEELFKDLSISKKRLNNLEDDRNYKRKKDNQINDQLLNFLIQKNRVDELYHILSMLDYEDLDNLCRSNKYFFNFCKQFKNSLIGKSLQKSLIKNTHLTEEMLSKNTLSDNLILYNYLNNPDDHSDCLRLNQISPEGRNHMLEYIIEKRNKKVKTLKVKLVKDEIKIYYKDKLLTFQDSMLFFHIISRFKKHNQMFFNFVFHSSKNKYCYLITIYALTGDFIISDSKFEDIFFD